MNKLILHRITDFMATNTHMTLERKLLTQDILLTTNLFISLRKDLVDLWSVILVNQFIYRLVAEISLKQVKGRWKDLIFNI